MMVLSVRDSVIYTFGDILFSILNYNVSFQLEDTERISHIEALTLARPEVKAVEMWGFGGGTIRLAGEPESDDDEGVTMFGVPLPTDLYGYQLRAGRWLAPADTHAIVLNQQLAEDAGVGVGDWVTIKQGTRNETNWLEVGLLFDPVITDSAHVPRHILLREIGSINKAQIVFMQTTLDDVESEIAIAKDLRVYYEENQVKVSPQPGAGDLVAGELITFDGSQSFDPDGQVVSYLWNFGDSGTASGAVVSHSSPQRAPTTSPSPSLTTWAPLRSCSRLTPSSLVDKGT